MANPAPIISQINAFNATEGTIISFNIVGGTSIVRSNIIYIYDLSDNSLICTHLYISTESIHELPANTDPSIAYASGKSSADFTNGKQYYAQIQTFTNTAGTEGASGASIAKLFWCLVDPTLTINAIPSSISTTSYNVGAVYNSNTTATSNIVQQYQFNLYSATGVLVQSSGVITGSGAQQGTSTAYDLSYNFTGLNVGSSYYITVEVTTTQGMTVSAQSSTFTVSIDTPTLGEATVVNNACDGYISVTSNLSEEYGGSASGSIATFETASVNEISSLVVDIEPQQDLHGYDHPWVGGAGKNKARVNATTIEKPSYWTSFWSVGGVYGDNGYIATRSNGQGGGGGFVLTNLTNEMCTLSFEAESGKCVDNYYHIYVHAYDGDEVRTNVVNGNVSPSSGRYSVSFALPTGTVNACIRIMPNTWIDGVTQTAWINKIQLELGSTATAFEPYSNICPISGHDEVGVSVTDEQKYNFSNVVLGKNWIGGNDTKRATLTFDAEPSTQYKVITEGGNFSAILFIRMENYTQITNMSINPPFNGYITTESNCNKVIVQFQKDTAITASDFDDFKCSISKEYESYTQDIEATYTPTVQENEPYQFKRTGDVGGDRESIELVGGTVAWNQLLPDGARTNTNNGVTYTREEGSPYVLNGTASGNAVFKLNITSYDAIIGHKYLMLGGKNADVYTQCTTVAVWGGSNPQDRGSGKIANAVANGTFDFVIIVKNGVTVTNVSVNPQLFDLTQMFGSTIADYIYSLEQANAGAGVAFFKSLFPKPYYAYNAGELMSVKALRHITRGFNAWDEEWESGYITSNGSIQSGSGIHSKNYSLCVPNTVYRGTCPASLNGLMLCWYDADKTFITRSNAKNTTATSPSNASYFKISTGGGDPTTYNHDICINLSWDGERDGEYEEYSEHVYELDPDLELRGIPKLSAGNDLYYDGDVYEPDGTVTRKYGIVDLGTLTWGYTSYGDGSFYASVPTIKKASSWSNVPNIVCSKYKTGTGNDVSNAGSADKVVSVPPNQTRVIIKDLSYGSDTAAFKTAMSGVYLVYELATPTTETADQFEEIQICSPYGTEEFVDNRAVPIPVGNNTQYYTRDIYGGTLDLVSGVLTVDRLVITRNTADMNNNEEYPGWKDAIFNEYFGNGRNVIVDEPLNIGELYGVNTVAAIGAIWLPISTYGKTQSEWIVLAQDIQITIPLATPQTYQLTPQQIQTLVGTNNVWSEQGNIELSYHIPITNLLVKRQDVADVSGSWLTLYSQPVTQASDMDFTFIDFLNQYGKTYKYALVPLLTQEQSGVEVEVEGGYTVSDEVVSIFDGVFVADNTAIYKLKAGVNYGDLSKVQEVGSINTIGSQYPIIVSNSKVDYRTASLSATIVADDYYDNGNLNRMDMVQKRELMESFFTNKRAKILKDWNGNIWLVVFIDNINITFINEYGMGIATLTATWTEIGDVTSEEDLQNTRIINVG